MKEPEEIIVYDQNCPMCQWYTGKFIQVGILLPEGRLGANELSRAEFADKMDMHRSRHEIPMYNRKTGTMVYGLDALGHLLGKKLPFVPVLLRWQIIRFPIKQLYRIISYNRQMIAGCRVNEAENIFGPEFNLFYRLLFMVVAACIAIFTSIAWGHAVDNHLSHFGYGISTLGATMILGAGWFMQMATAVATLGKRAMDYLAHLFTNMIIGSLLLIPSNMLASVNDYKYWQISVVGILLSVGVMMWQHWRRMRNWNFSQKLTISWFVWLMSAAVLGVCFFVF